MPRVHNKKANTAPADAIYVGRPTKWGNPFSHQNGTLAQFKVATRDEAVEAYTRWILDPAQMPLRKQLHELKGKDLVCWCYPARCHATVLVNLANDDTTPF